MDGEMEREGEKERVRDGGREGGKDRGRVRKCHPSGSPASAECCASFLSRKSYECAWKRP